MEKSNNKNKTHSKYQIDLIDDFEEWDKNDYIKDWMDFGDFQKFLPVMMVSGQSMSGKSNFILNLFKRRFIHQDLDFNNFYIFSSTAMANPQFRPLYKYIIKHTDVKNFSNMIYDTVNVDLIKNILRKQEQISKEMLMAKNKNVQPELPNYVFLFDDILSDKQFKHHGSFVNGLASMCRHYNILLIILTQVWQRIPNTIRQQSNLSILMSSDNYSEKYLIGENCKYGQFKQLSQLYNDINSLKNYSFLIINKSKTDDKRNLVIYNQNKNGIKFEYIEMITDANK